jgi:hypothetical protein
MAHLPGLQKKGAIFIIQLSNGGSDEPMHVGSGAAGFIHRRKHGVLTGDKYHRAGGYFVWGSTFLAIRVGVREVPPLILAAMRFFVAGVVLYGWMIARGERSPSGREWRSAALLGIVIFVFDYGLLFWAEQRVPSGIAAVMLATIPVFMALSEIIFFANADADGAVGAGALDRDWRSGGADEPVVESWRSAGRQNGGGGSYLCVHELVGSVGACAQAAVAGIEGDEFGERRCSPAECFW